MDSVVTRIETLRAELKAIEYWDRMYWTAVNAARCDKASYVHRQKRREEILTELRRLKDSSRMGKVSSGNGMQGQTAFLLLNIGSTITKALESVAMQDQQKERWRELCEQAIDEQDLQKLVELVNEIDRLLGGKEPTTQQR
jgi:phage terminase Nu1 subunit (DNA packaging protein)